MYDLVGKIKQVTDPTGTYGFAYDNMGRLVGTTTQYSFVTGTYSNAYTYDAASNRTSLTAPDGSITTYGYDTLNRLNGLANSWAGSFGFGYDALSRRTSLTRPNGVNTSYSYDSLSRLLSVLHQASGTTIDGASYTYDNAGNRTSKTNDLNGITENYTYDALYELTQVTQGGSTTESYSYDAVGNRLSSLGVPLYNYNSSNELTSSSQGNYTYDANGNTLTDAQGRSFTWDFENRLAQATNPGVGTTTFRYDPFGRRIQKSGPLGTTNYLYDGASVIQELGSDGSILTKSLGGPSIDERLAALSSGLSAYYQQDGLGSASSLTDSRGSVLETHTFDSYGTETASSGSTISVFRHAAREFDRETGLYFNRARYFDSSVGHFISEDPIGFRGGANFYAYVYNNPVNLVDPFGLRVASPEYCARLLDRIQNIQNKIDERLGELDEDPKSLPETCPGDDLKPSLSRAGHRMLINMDKANLAAQKALYLALCGNEPPGAPLAVPPPTPNDNYFDRRFWERTTGLTGAALVSYLIISEGSRLYPPRNLVPVP